MNPQNKIKDIHVVGIGLLLILGVVVLSVMLSADDSSSGNSEDNNTPSISAEDYTYISASDLKNQLLQDNSYILIDLREVVDFQLEHIVGSYNAPLREIQEHLNSLPQGNKLVIIGYENQLTSTITGAKAIEAKTGKTPIILTGGFASWKANEYPTLSIADPSSFSEQSKVSYIAPGEVSSFVKNTSGVFELDVRLSTEFVNNHRPNAYNIPLPLLESRRTEIPVARKILVYGDDAIESFQAGVQLFDMGFYQVETLDGSYSDIASTEKNSE